VVRGAGVAVAALVGAAATCVGRATAVTATAVDAGAAAAAAADVGLTAGTTVAVGDAGAVGAHALRSGIAAPSATPPPIRLSKARRLSRAPLPDSNAMDILPREMQRIVVASSHGLNGPAID
jgi:hypothetical protein